MDEFFGLSMTTIMIVLLAVLAVCLSTVAYVVLRNRILFLMGLRNMPRRMAQTLLIVIGLMLSTLIISAALSTGDTVDYSISKLAYETLGHVDETIQPGNLQKDASSLGDSGLDVEADQYRDFQQAIKTANDPNIDGSMGVLFEPAPVLNPTSRLSEPYVELTGLDTSALDGFPDVISAKDGHVLDIASLGPNEAYMNEKAADKLGTRPGDTVQFWVNNEQHEFKILDIVKDRVLTGVANDQHKEGIVTRLDTLQKLFGHERVSFIAISNRGGVRDSVALTDSVENDLRGVIQNNNLRLGLGDSKDDGIRTAEQIGNFMATFFMILGLFSIGAGVLLIIMIFVMLAAERKSEMGMARAVGMKRGHLVQMFLSEGTAYNILSAMVGAGLGILVSFGMAYIMSSIFASSDFGVTIEPHFTPRSLLIAYSLGVILTFVTVTFASFRISNLNIVAAIRGTAEDKRSQQRPKTNWGVVGLGLAVSLVPFLGLLLIILKRGGIPRSWPWVLLSIFGYGYLGSWLFFNRGFGATWGWLLHAVLPFLLIPPLTPIGLWIILRGGLGLPSAWILSGFGLLFGTMFFLLGLSSDKAFPFALGFSLMGAGFARLLTVFKLPDRPVYTAVGIFLIALWGLTAGGRLEFLFGTLSGDIEMFFLSGVAMVTAATYVLIYNSDIILALVTRIGGAFGTILPAVKTAVAYPLENRFRTGMTLAMISLVVFSLTMMSTMNFNFDRLFLSDESRGGWDVRVEENANNHIADLDGALRSGGSSTPDQFRTEGRVSLGGAASSTEVRQDLNGKFEDYPVVGADKGFLENSSIPLDHRARGYETDHAVWQELLAGKDVAVIDSFAVRRGGFNDSSYDFKVSGINENDKTFDPITLQIHAPLSRKSKQVQVIGVTSLGASTTFAGLYIPDSSFREVFGEPALSNHFIGLKDPSKSKDVAKDIESTLLTAGVQSDSIKAKVDEDQALSRNFFYLMQGFMSLGLLVGIAAVGVIAFRMVVERRQQIGMLRAIGYKRSTVALSFLFESSFVTLLAIVSGMLLAIWLSYFLLSAPDFPTNKNGYAVPWLQLVFFGVFTYLASLLMTFIPARQAASIPTAEALRYE